MNSNNPKEKGQNFIRGSQIFFQNLGMLVEASSVILKVALLLFLAFEILVLWLWVSGSDWYFFYQYVIAKFYIGLISSMATSTTDFIYHGVTYHVTYGAIAADTMSQGIFRSVMHKMIFSGIVGGILFVIGVVWATGFFRKEGQKLSQDKYIRGAKRVPLAQYLFRCKGVKKSPLTIPVIQNIAKVSKQNDYSVAEVEALPLPLNFEVQHVLIHGTTGVGKSQLTFHLANQIQEISQKQSSKRIYIDVGCNLIGKLYNPETDVILSPFDQRSVRWDLWSEFVSDIDFANLASYLIPLAPTVSDPYWINASRMMLASAAYSMADEADRSIEKLLKLLLLSELSELCRYLSDTEASVVTSEKTAKTSISVRSVLATYVRPLKYLMGMQHLGGKPFSIKSWVQDESKTGSLFITIPEDKREEMKGLVTLWFSCAIDALLAMEPKADRRVYFICDELGVMFKMKRLMTGLALGRKYGASFILGMQSYNQCVETYGINAAKELIDLMSYRFYFRSNEESTARFVSASLGDEEVESSTLNRTYSGGHERQGVSMINQLLTRPVVTYSEVMDLKNLECFIKPSEGLPITKIHLMPYFKASHSEGLVLRNIEQDVAIEQSLKEVNKQVTEDVVAVKKVLPKSASTGVKTTQTSDTSQSPQLELTPSLPGKVEQTVEQSTQAIDGLEVNKSRQETHTQLDGQGNLCLSNPPVAGNILEIS